MKIQIPECSVVLLVGPSSSGKSTFARKYFLPTERVSSDDCRAMVSDDEGDQSCNADAYEVLRKIARARLRHNKVVVVDATNTKYEDRKEMIDVAKRGHVRAIAICFDLPEDVLFARHEAREDRTFGKQVVRRQIQNCRKSWRNIKKDGFQQVYWIKSEEDAENVEIERVKLPTNRKDVSGPFDIIGDVHGCYDELLELLVKLGYEVSDSAVSHPEGRQVIFVGDFADRGPKNVEIYKFVRMMVNSGVAHAVRGNHDDKLCRYLWRTRLLEDRDACKMKLNHGLDKTMEQFAAEPKQFRQETRDFVNTLPYNLVFDEGKLVVAHAGLAEKYHGGLGKRVEEFCLYGDTTGETDEQGFPIRKDWAQEYRGSALVVHGHTVVEEAVWVNNVLCVDTGCVFGGELTALRYPERELVSVKAKEQYAEHGGAPKKSKRDYHDLLDIKDVSGRRTITTRFGEKALIDSRSAEAALDSVSRFTVAPNWLIYLPPTMSPSETATGDNGFLEHPEQAFDYYQKNGVVRVVCQEKHMGSRAVVVVCRNEEVAQKRFHATHGQIGSIFSRTGRPMFINNEADGRSFLEKIQVAITRAGLWEELNSDWVCIDAEFLPWSAKASSLLRSTFAPTAAAGIPSLKRAVAMLEKVEAEGGSALLERFRSKVETMDLYRDSYRRYCWHVNSLDDLKLAPFHLLASEDAVHSDKDHLWHINTLAKLADGDDDWIVTTPYQLVDVADRASRDAAIAWWTERTGSGSEGCVVKPLAWVLRGEKRMIQPAVKCRGKEYLRIIYGPEYDSPENLERLRHRKVGMKRMMAAKEYALGLEALSRFVNNEPLYRVHECVFAVLAMESEPIDPRL